MMSVRNSLIRHHNLEGDGVTIGADGNPFEV